MILEILQIKRDPPTVNKDATLLTGLIQMSVEWSNNFDALFTVTELFNLNLLAVIEDPAHLDLLEGVIGLELIDAGRLGPLEIALVGRSDIEGSLTQERSSIHSLMSVPAYLLWASFSLSALRLSWNS